MTGFNNSTNLIIMGNCKTDSLVFNEMYSHGEDISSEPTEPQKTNPISPAMHAWVAIGYLY